MRASEPFEFRVLATIQMSFAINNHHFPGFYLCLLMATVAYHQHVTIHSMYQECVWTTKHWLTQTNYPMKLSNTSNFSRTIFFWSFRSVLFFFSSSNDHSVGRWSDLILMRQQSMRINVILNLFIHNFSLSVFFLFISWQLFFSSFSANDFQT